MAAPGFLFRGKEWGNLMGGNVYNFMFFLPFPIFSGGKQFSWGGGDFLPGPCSATTGHHSVMSLRGDGVRAAVPPIKLVRAPVRHQMKIKLCKMIISQHMGIVPQFYLLNIFNNHFNDKVRSYKGMFSLKIQYLLIRLGGTSTPHSNSTLFWSGSKQYEEGA